MARCSVKRRKQDEPCASLQRRSKLSDIMHTRSDSWLLAHDRQSSPSFQIPDAATILRVKLTKNEQAASARQFEKRQPSPFTRRAIEDEPLFGHALAVQHGASYSAAS